MFHKIRMRRHLRRIIATAVPDGLRHDRGAVAARALLLERAAIAHGLTWHGLSAAQAALVVALAARVLTAPGAADAALVSAAAGRFADRRGLGAFAAGIARDVARLEGHAADHGRRLTRTTVTLHGASPATLPDTLPSSRRDSDPSRAPSTT